MTDDEEAKLDRIGRELKDIRVLVQAVVTAIRDAESEVPEKLRRFANYFHDMHDIKYMYEEHGQHPPEDILREIERLHDRYRQIIREMKSEGGSINKVLREMAGDPENKYDHTKQLPKPKENGNEAG